MHPKTLQAPGAPPTAAQDIRTTLAQGWPALPAIGVVFVLLRLGFDHGGTFPAAFAT